MQGVAGVLIELTQEVQELEESITNKVHQLIAGMTAVEHVQGAEEHLERLEESVEGIRGLVEGLQQQVVKVQRIEKGLQSLATFHSTQLLKGVTTLDLSALPSPSYHTLLFHLLSLSLHHSASLSTVFTVKAFPAMTTPCLQQTILTGITALDLRHCTRITCRSMHHIRQLQHLHTLNLAWVADSAADSAPGERWIRALGPMEELAWLSLFGWLLRDEGAIGVARGGVKKMVKKLPCLRELWLLGGSEEP
ncbi:unnamed protein product [Closterium sp. Yama58-4]|nr:unnamed protein product [Closterium sp. Yama58-4]